MLNHVNERPHGGDETRTDGGTNALEGLNQVLLDRASSTTSDPTAVELPDDASTSEGPSLELDQVFGLLKNRRRRDVLRYLAGVSEQVRLGEIAESIGARECGKDVSQLKSQERKRVYIALYQCHLPKMADADVVAYNQPRGTVERGPNFDQVTAHLPARGGPKDQQETGRTWLPSLTSLFS